MEMGRKHGMSAAMLVAALSMGAMGQSAELLPSEPWVPPVPQPMREQGPSGTAGTSRKVKAKRKRERDAKTKARRKNRGKK